MAGFADLVRSLVAVADGLTDSLQVAVTHYSYASATKDATQKVTWGSGVSRKALVEDVHTMVRDQQGQMVLVTTKVTFLRSFAIDARDRIVLPGGKEAPIARIAGLVDPDGIAGGRYLLEVWLL